MTAARFTDRPTSERLALVESHLGEQDDRLCELVAEVKGIRSDFTELRIELAQKRSTPPRSDSELHLPKWLVLALLALLPGLGAGLLKLGLLLAGK